MPTRKALETWRDENVARWKRELKQSKLELKKLQKTKKLTRYPNGKTIPEDLQSSYTFRMNHELQDEIDDLQREIDEWSNASKDWLREEWDERSSANYLADEDAQRSPGKNETRISAPRDTGHVRESKSSGGKKRSRRKSNLKYPSLTIRDPDDAKAYAAAVARSARNRSELPERARVVLLAFCEIAYERHCVDGLSLANSEIEVLTGLVHSTTQRWIRWLIEHGYLKRLSGRPNLRRIAAKYKLLRGPDAEWIEEQRKKLYTFVTEDGHMWSDERMETVAQSHARV